jgi:hypothetical protein
VLREVADHVREKQERAGANDPAERLPADGQSAADDPKTDQGEDRSGQSVDTTRVLCIGGRSELDQAVAEMMAGALTDEPGISVRVLSPGAVATDALARLDLEDVDVVCLSYLHPRPEVYARYVFRRLRRKAPRVRLLACLWNYGAATEAGRDAAELVAADAVATSIAAMRRQIEVWTPENAV